MRDSIVCTRNIYFLYVNRPGEIQIKIYFSRILLSPVSIIVGNAQFRWSRPIVFRRTQIGVLCRMVKQNGNPADFTPQ
jgi:hypothetical protein